LDPNDQQPEEVNEIEAIVRYDPFAEQPEVAEPEPAPAEPEAPVAEPEVPAAPVPNPSEVLAMQLAAQQKELLEKLTPKEEPKAPDAPAGFTAQVPPELVQALQSDNPQDVHNAVNHIVNGTAMLAYSRAKAEFEQLLATQISTLRSSLPQLMTEHTTAVQTQEQARQVFYTAYPKLANPMVRPMVQSAAEAVAQEWQQGNKPFTGMTPEFAAAVAGKIAAGLGIPIEAFAAEVPRVQQQPKPQAFNPAQSARPSNPSPDPFAKIGLDIF
jgi:hypothetical protein